MNDVTKSRAMNEAVVLFRKTTLALYDIEFAEKRLAQKVAALDGEELKMYVQLTNEIEEAIAAVAGANRATIRKAANTAGTTG